MKSKNTLVIGASVKPTRYAFMAVNALVEEGYSVTGIGHTVGEVAGVKIQTNQIPLENIDTVTLYINPLHQQEYYDYIIGLKPKRVIFNPGTENPEFYQLLQAQGIIVEVACTLVLLSTNQY